MNFVIHKSILEETVHCRKDFECLKNDNSLCITKKVENCVDGRILFLKCNEMCSYKMTYGNSAICNCPTRKEIFRKYNR